MLASDHPGKELLLPPPLPEAMGFSAYSGLFSTATSPSCGSPLRGSNLCDKGCFGCLFPSKASSGGAAWHHCCPSCPPHPLGLLPTFLPQFLRRSSEKNRETLFIGQGRFEGPRLDMGSLVCTLGH